MTGMAEMAKRVGIDYEHLVGEVGDGFYCLCGCLEKTRWTGKKWVLFRPGHDAKLVAALLRKARVNEININEAIEALEYCTDSDRLSNKLRGLWLRVGQKMTPKRAWDRGMPVVCAMAPHEGQPAEYAPRNKYDSQPWRVGILRYNNSEVRIAD